jgi:hypothetical protein
VPEVSVKLKALTLRIVTWCKSQTKLSNNVIVFKRNSLNYVIFQGVINALNELTKDKILRLDLERHRRKCSILKYRR